MGPYTQAGRSRARAQASGCGGGLRKTWRCKCRPVRITQGDEQGLRCCCGCCCCRSCCRSRAAVHRRPIRHTAPSPVARAQHGIDGTTAVRTVHGAGRVRAEGRRHRAAATLRDGIENAGVLGRKERCGAWQYGSSIILYRCVWTGVRWDGGRAASGRRAVGRRRWERPG